MPLERCGRAPPAPDRHVGEESQMTTTTAMPVVGGVRHYIVQAGGLGFHVAEAGDGTPVLMLHGFPQHWYAWRKVIPLLPGSRLICPDLRGFGWSDAPRRGYDVA